MTLAFAAVVAAALPIPHLLPLDRARPVTAASIWFLALALRALAAVFTAIVVVLYLPGSKLFELVTHWCWDAVLPFVEVHLGISGHHVGAVAVVAPAFALAASGVSVGVGLWRAARRIRQLVAHKTVGSGPDQSVVIADAEVVVAAAGLRHPRVVVSAGALTALDDRELAASLAHEQGHILRRHRFIIAVSELCRAVGRFIPGTATASRELLFHLERDADHWALSRRHDASALASAICKAAESEIISAPAFGLRGSAFTRRVEGLLAVPPAASPTLDRCLRAIAAGMAVVMLAGMAAMPAAANAGLHASGGAAHHCAH